MTRARGEDELDPEDYVTTKKPKKGKVPSNKKVKMMFNVQI